MFQRLRIASFTLLALLVYAASSAAIETTIVATNSALSECTLTLTGSAPFTTPPTSIAPLATQTVTKVTRSDEATHLDLTLTTVQGDLTLTVEMEGDVLTWGLSGGNLTISPKSWSGIQVFPLNLGGAEYSVAVKTDDTDDGGTLALVLQKSDEKPAMGNANALNVLSYNVWATTIYGSKKVYERLALMPDVMADYDVLVLTEVFDLIPSTKLLKALKDEYPYQSAEIFRAGKLMKSGTRILSRWPFIEENSHIYDACNDIQCAASRGVIHTRINKMGQIYNIFATHTQSSDDTDNRNARLDQIEEMGDFARGLNLPENEPVIFAGDFNVNKVSLPEDLVKTKAALEAVEPENLGHNLSYDCDTNAWASPPYREYLDYTLYGENHLTPAQSSQEIFAPRAITPELWGIWDLSDHYAARGTFLFDVDADPQRTAFPYFGDVVHFKTHNGHFMRAMSGGGSFISAGSSRIGTWESFTLENLGNGFVAIKDRSGNYLRVHSWLFGTIRADSSSVGKRERFKWVDMDHGKIALKAWNGRYLRADFGGGAGLSAGAWRARAYECFELIRR